MQPLQAMALLGLILVSNACLSGTPAWPTPASSVSVQAPGSQHRPQDAPQVQWKERMGQGYLYLEQRGDYRDLDKAMARLAEATSELGGSSASAPPFLLLYDDPGVVPTEELRARVCIPIDRRPEELDGPLAFDMLPPAMVVYARLMGRASEAMRSVPSLMDSMRELGGQPSGPIREVLLPADARTAEPRTEVQIPWSRAGA